MKLLSQNMQSGRIARRLILAMVLFSSLITLVVTAAQLYRDYNRDLLLIDTQLKQIQDVHLRSIAGNLWLLDETGMQTLVEGIIQLPDILYLEVNDGDRVWASSGSRQSENIIERRLPLVYEHQGKEQQIGHITAVATLDRVYQRLIDKAIDILVSNAIKTFLVAGFMLLLFYYLVTRHLTDIADYLRNHSLEAASEPLHLDRDNRIGKMDDELDMVVNELNLMRHNLENSYTTLKQSEIKYRELYDTMAQGVIYRDESGRVLSANNAAQRILGLTLDQMQRDTNINATWQAIAENGQPLPDDAFPTAQSLRHGEDVDNLVMGLYHPLEKSYRWLLASSKTSVGKNNDGGRIAFSTFTDITERKIADQERERLIKELEVKNRELERFVYTISHELKTPLVTIAGFSGILASDIEQNDKDKLTSHLRHITAAVDTMSVLLDELLELSRVGRIINTPENVSMHELIQDVARMVERQAAERGVRIEIGTDIPETFGDRIRLREVVQNLTENAIKFSAERPDPRIKIGCRVEGKEPIYYVQDNGKGVEPVYHEKIFGLFERLDPEIEGTGLGLALAQRIMEEHGGRIWVESDGRDSGSTFCFTIPRRTAT